MAVSMPRAAWPDTLPRATTAAAPAPRFAFRGRGGRERVDWRLIAAVDPDAVQRDGDLDALQAVIENLTFADVQGEGVRTMADANLVKLARLSQLCLEYLLHCQEALDQQSTQAAADAARWRAEVEATRTEAKTLGKRLAHMKKALRSYEHLSVARKEAGLEAHEPVDVFKCHDGKLFVTEKHALAHVQKRYPAGDREALQALIVRVPAAQRTDAGGSAQAAATAKAIQDARAETEAKRQQLLALEARMSDLASANKSLAEQLEALNSSVHNAQHLQHTAESRADHLEADKNRLTASLSSVQHELELERQRARGLEQVHALETKRLREMADETEKRLKAEVERERTEKMSSISNLLSNTSSLWPSRGPMERSRAGFMEDDESSGSADESTARPRKARGSIGPRAERLLEAVLRMSNMAVPDAAPAAAGGGGVGDLTTEKFVNERIEVGMLRQALEEQQAKGAQTRALAREQQQNLLAQHQRELAEVHEAHAAALQHKELLLKKAHEQSRRASDELDVVQSELRQSVQEALSLRRQLETIQSHEKDAAGRARDELIHDLQGQKSDLETELLQLKGSAKLLARERAQVDEALEVAGMLELTAIRPFLPCKPGSFDFSCVPQSVSATEQSESLSVSRCS